MEEKTLNSGQKSKDYPFGYGYCQCGCGKPAPRLSNGAYLRFIGTHNPLKIARIEKEKFNRAKGVWLKNYIKMAQIEKFNKVKSEWLKNHKQEPVEIDSVEIDREIIIAQSKRISWSGKYDKCIGCETTERPHWAHGYCSRCYPKFIVRKTGDFNREDKEYYSNFMNKLRGKISSTQKLKRRAKIPITHVLIPDLLEELYNRKQKSLEDIAKIYGCSRTYIYKLCKKYNIAVRAKGKAREVAQLSGKLPDRSFHKVNDRFFSEWNNDMAYVLGFIYADGYIHGQFGAVIISQKEPEILEKIKKLMESSQTLKHYKHQDIYHLVIGRKRIMKDLLRLGLTPAKSLIVRFPNMPDQCISHFIRGYFDGDGTICRQGRGWKVSIVSGSRDMIERIKVNFEKFATVGDTKVYKRKDANAYTIGYNSRDNITKVFNFFYDEYTLKNELYLARKHNLFKEAINEFNNWNPRQIKTYEMHKRIKILEETHRRIQGA